MSIIVTVFSLIAVAFFLGVVVAIATFAWFDKYSGETWRLFLAATVVVTIAYLGANALWHTEAPSSESFALSIYEVFKFLREYPPSFLLWVASTIGAVVAWLIVSEYFEYDPDQQPAYWYVFAGICSGVTFSFFAIWHTSLFVISFSLILSARFAAGIASWGTETSPVEAYTRSRGGGVKYFTGEWLASFEGDSWFAAARNSLGQSSLAALSFIAFHQMNHHEPMLAGILFAALLLGSLLGLFLVVATTERHELAHCGVAVTVWVLAIGIGFALGMTQEVVHSLSLHFQ